MNITILSGRLAWTPELRYTTNKKIPVTTLRLATKEQGETVWHNITVWDKEAELCCKYLEKGSSITVNARISYQDTLVDEKKFTVPEIVANHVEFH